MPKNGHGSNRRDKQKKKGTQRAEEYRYGNYPNYYSKRKAAFKTLNPGKRGPSTGGIGENKTRDNQEQAQPSLQTRMDLDSDLDLNLDLNKELDQNILENCTTSSDPRIETLLNIRVTTTPQSSNTGCSNNKLFANKIAKVLDIGCNTAAVAIELAKRTNIQRIIGVDIDNSLIRTARQNLYFENSLTRPLINQKKSAVSKNEQEQDREWERDEKRCYEDEHYPISMPILFGTIPHQHGQNSTNNSLADRVFLYAADWVNDDTTWLDNTNNQEADVSGNGGEGDEQGSKDKYDVIMALNVSKWIHLNNLDEGIIKFFKKVYNSLKESTDIGGSSGYFIFEPQDWKGYYKASKTNSELRQNYHQLKIRPEDFPKILVSSEIGFKKFKVLNQTSSNKGYDRPIYLFYK